MTLDPALVAQFSGILSLNPQKNKDGTFNRKKMCKPLRRLKSEWDFVEYVFTCLNECILYDFGPKEGCAATTGLFLFERAGPWVWKFCWEKDRSVNVVLAYKKKPSLRLFKTDLCFAISEQRKMFGGLGMLLDQSHWEANVDSEYDTKNND